MKKTLFFISILSLIYTKIIFSKEEGLNTAFQQGKYAEIISNFSAQIGEDGNTDVLYPYAFSLLKLKFPILANFYFEKSKNIKSKEESDILYRYVEHIHADKSHPFPYGSDFMRLIKKDMSRFSTEEKFRGMLHFHTALEWVNAGDIKKAIHELQQVLPTNSEYGNALFLLGVLENRLGEVKRSKSYFLKSYDVFVQMGDSDPVLKEQSALNIARLYYEEKNFKEAIVFYSKISENSEFWLQALLESAWAFYFMDKTGNSLGNLRTILSSFYEKRFYPEAYVIQGISLIKNCYFKSAAKSGKFFQKKYKPILNEMKNIDKKSKETPSYLYEIFDAYMNRKLFTHEEIGGVFDRILQEKIVQREFLILKLIKNEFSQIRNSSFPENVKEKLKDQLMKINGNRISNLSALLMKKFQRQMNDLNDFSIQIQLINAQSVLGSLDVLRSEMHVGIEQKNVQYIGGMKEMKIDQKLEYWPFEGEYWRDELGGYVYKISNICRL